MRAYLSIAGGGIVCVIAGLPGVALEQICSDRP